MKKLLRTIKAWFVEPAEANWWDPPTGIITANELLHILTKRKAVG